MPHIIIAKLTTLKHKKFVTAIPIVWLLYYYDIVGFKWLGFLVIIYKAFVAVTNKGCHSVGTALPPSTDLEAISCTKGRDISKAVFKDCTIPLVMLVCQINCKADHINSTSGVLACFLWLWLCFLHPCSKWAANHCKQKLQWCDIILWESYFCKDFSNRCNN